jgi:hypothetical protein
MTSKNAGTSAKEDQARKDNSRRLTSVTVLFLILSCLVILILSIFLYNDYAKSTGLGRLPVSIRADSQADYHPDATKDVFPQINKNILDQIITEIPATGSPQDRESTLEAALLSPVPTMTPDHRLVAPATPTSTPTEIPIFTPSPTGSFTPSQTPNPIRTFTLTVTRTYTPTVTRTYTPTFTRTFTITPTRTSSPTYSPTHSLTLTRSPTNTFTPTYTPTDTPTFTRTPTYTPTPTETPTDTSTFTRTPTDTFTPTYTPTPTETPTDTPTFTRTPTETPTDTPTFTPTATLTNTPAGPVACDPSEIIYSSSPNIYFNVDELLADITNNSSSAIRITELHLDWQDAGPTKLDFIRLGGTYIWDINGNLYDDTPPSDFAVSGSEFSWNSSSNGARTINAGNSGNMKTLLINFDPDTDPLPAGLYILRVTFGLSANCYIETSITKP